MTDFMIPNVFIAGTKAKAYEVNENFEAIRKQINDHKNSISSTTDSLSTLKDYVENGLTDEIRNSIKENKTRYCINSGNTSLLTINSADPSQLDFNIDENNPIIATGLDGISFKKENLSSLDCSALENGKYNIFFNSDKDPYPLANNLYFQTKEPSASTWEQPVLTENGTLGGDLFAVSADYNLTDYVYYAFDTSEQFWTSAGNEGNYIIYNPIAINITKVDITNRNHNYIRAIVAGTIYGSDDNSSWEKLTEFTNSATGQNATWTIDMSSNDKYYKYYKFNLLGDGTHGSIMKMTLTATEKISDNSIWVNAATEPFSVKKLDNTEWVDFEDILIGSITVENGVITNAETCSFNFNGYDINASLGSKELVTNWLLPDYENPIMTSFALNTIYQAPCNCLVICPVYTENNINTSLNFYIGKTKQLTKFYVQQGTSYVHTWTIFVPKDYYFKFTAGHANSKIYTTPKCLMGLFPLKGVEK